MLVAVGLSCDQCGTDGRVSDATTTSIELTCPLCGRVWVESMNQRDWILKTNVGG